MGLLNMDESYAERDLNVGFSGGEKKKAEILQMLMLEPKLAILDETDSGLDVDAVRTVSEGVRLFRDRTHGSLLIITHSTRILEALHVDAAHVMEEGGTIEWISGSFGSHVGCLYPMSILKGDNSRMEFTGVTFAGAGQNLDTGAKVVHVGKNTSSYMNTRSISKSGGISTFRSSVVVEKGAKGAKGAKSAVSCQSLMLDSESRSDTIPAMDIRTKDAAIGHEAKIGAISNEAVFYLMSRGMSEEDARAMIVSGFADNVSKELPVEYAVEMNNLIRLEMKGSIG